VENGIAQTDAITKFGMSSICDFEKGFAIAADQGG
jgi:hypothetical protein